MNQLKLWISSPTNTGFGSTLLMTLQHACLDLLCFRDVLVQQLSAHSSFPYDDISSNPVIQSSDVHDEVFGFELDFSQLMKNLEEFTKTFEGNEKFIFVFSLC